jgi:hypothetical protein
MTIEPQVFSMSNGEMGVQYKFMIFIFWGSCHHMDQHNQKNHASYVLSECITWTVKPCQRFQFFVVEVVRSIPTTVLLVVLLRTVLRMFSVRKDVRIWSTLSHCASSTHQTRDLRPLIVYLLHHNGKWQPIQYCTRHYNIRSGYNIVNFLNNTTTSFRVTYDKVHRNRT